MAAQPALERTGPQQRGRIVPHGRRGGVTHIGARQTDIREHARVEMRERGGGTSSITALRSIYYMTKVLLAIFVGLFRRYAVPLEEEHR